MSQLARLTHLGTQTLTILAERQRLEALGRTPPATSTNQAVRNLANLRAGILSLEQANDGGPVHQWSIKHGLLTGAAQVRLNTILCFNCPC